MTRGAENATSKRGGRTTTTVMRVVGVFVVCCLLFCSLFFGGIKFVSVFYVKDGCMWELVQIMERLDCDST